MNFMNSFMAHHDSHALGMMLADQIRQQTAAQVTVCTACLSQIARIRDQTTLDQNVIRVTVACIYMYYQSKERSDCAATHFVLTSISNAKCQGPSPIPGFALEPFLNERIDNQEMRRMASNPLTVAQLKYWMVSLSHVSSPCNDSCTRLHCRCFRFLSTEKVQLDCTRTHARDTSTQTYENVLLTRVCLGVRVSVHDVCALLG